MSWVTDQKSRKTWNKESGVEVCGWIYGPEMKWGNLCTICSCHQWWRTKQPSRQVTQPLTSASLCHEPLQCWHDGNMNKRGGNRNGGYSWANSTDLHLPKIIRLLLPPASPCLHQRPTMKSPMWHLSSSLPQETSQPCGGKLTLGPFHLERSRSSFYVLREKDTYSGYGFAFPDHGV